jgi:hypothetical protein
MNVAHLGRHPNAFQRTALEWLYPASVVKGCNQQVRIEWDHRKDRKDPHETALQNLDGLCRYHHRMKTVRGWMLVGGRGTREFVAPEDPRHPRDLAVPAPGRAGTDRSKTSRARPNCSCHPCSTVSDVFDARRRGSRQTSSRTRTERVTRMSGASETT